MKHDKRVVDISGIPTAGQRGHALIDLPTGVRIHEINLALTAGAALTAAQGFGDIVLLRNGRPQRRGSITQLDNLAAAFGNEYGIQDDVAGGPAQFWIAFSEWFRKQYATQEASSWDVGQNETLQLEIEVLAAATGVAIECLAVIDDAVELQARPIRKVFRHQEVVGGQTLSFNKLSKKDRYATVQFYDPTGVTIDEVKCTRDGKVIFDRTRAENSAILGRKQILQADGTFLVVADDTDSPLDWWDMDGVRELEFELTLSGAGGTGQVVAMVERYGQPE